MTVHKGDIIRIQQDNEIIQGRITRYSGTMYVLSTPVGDVFVNLEGGDFDIIEKATRVPECHDIVVDDGTGDKWVRMYSGRSRYQLVSGSITHTPEEFAENYPEWSVVYELD